MYYSLDNTNLICFTLYNYLYTDSLQSAVHKKKKCSSKSMNRLDGSAM